MLIMFYKNRTKNKTSKYHLRLNPKIKFLGLLALYLLGGSLATTSYYPQTNPPLLQEEISIYGIVIAILIVIPYIFNNLSALGNALDDNKPN